MHHLPIKTPSLPHILQDHILLPHQKNTLWKRHQVRILSSPFLLQKRESLRLEVGRFSLFQKHEMHPAHGLAGVLCNQPAIILKIQNLCSMWHTFQCIFYGCVIYTIFHYGYKRSIRFCYYKVISFDSEENVTSGTINSLACKLTWNNFIGIVGNFSNFINHYLSIFSIGCISTIVLDVLCELM